MLFFLCFLPPSTLLSLCESVRLRGHLLAYGLRGGCFLGGGWGRGGRERGAELLGLLVQGEEVLRVVLLQELEELGQLGLDL